MVFYRPNNKVTDYITDYLTTLPIRQKLLKIYIEWASSLTIGDALCTQKKEEIKNSKKKMNEKKREES